MRMAPTKRTLRELYLRSGNQCAFPGCTAGIIDANGDFVGQICHIEAASPEGQRFNPSQTDEERRSFANLMLMCYPHHKTTNHVDQYTVEVLRRMKSDHESKFSDIAAIIGSSIVDWTATQKFIGPRNIGKLDSGYPFRLGEEESRISAQELTEFLRPLDDVPNQARKVFAVMLKRMTRHDRGRDFVDPRKIEEVLAMSPADLDRHLVLLADAGVCSRVICDEYAEPRIDLFHPPSGWELWRDLMDFCTRTGTPIEDLILGLDFSCLEDIPD